MNLRGRSFILAISLLGFACGGGDPEPTSAPVNMARSAPEVSLIQLHRNDLGAFQLNIQLRITLQRGPTTRKLYRESTMQFDKQGKWNLVKNDPLLNERWEIISLGEEEHLLYLRKNRQPFRFAADPFELRRWLETALQDFYKLIQAERDNFIHQHNLPEKSQIKKIHDLTAHCFDWTKSASEDRTLHLCFYEKDGIVLEGSLLENKTESAQDYPLTTKIEAQLTLQGVGDKVKEVVAPSAQ